MVAGAFPVLKLGVLAVRQISKPLVNVFKRRAKTSRLFRNGLCLPVAQFYHWADTTVKMRILGLGQPKSVAPLNEHTAVELGAEILGEVVTFSVAVATAAYEYNRSSEKSAREKEELNDRLARLEARVDFLTFENERQSAQIRETQHNYAFLTSPLGKLKQKMAAAGGTTTTISADSPQGEGSGRGLVGSAVDACLSALFRQPSR